MKEYSPKSVRSGHFDIYDVDSCFVRISIGISNWDINNRDVGHGEFNFTKMEININ